MTVWKYDLRIMGSQPPKLGDLLQCSTSGQPEFVDIDLASQTTTAKAWPLSLFQQALEPLPQRDSLIASSSRTEGLTISERLGVRNDQCSSSCLVAKHVFSFI